jgi:hypothetical protein
MSLVDDLYPVSNTLNEISGIDEIESLFSKSLRIFDITNLEIVIRRYEFGLNCGEINGDYGYVRIRISNVNSP